jgi:predicted homoserine dehydrogenase-like protein
VFVVVTGSRPATLRALRSKGVPLSADGSRGLLWRPLPLVGVETPVPVAQAVRFRTGTAAPRREPTVEVIAVAKGDLPAGTALEGIGAGQVLGLAEMADVAARERLLPLALADRVRLRRPVRAGVALTADDLEAPGDTPCRRRRRLSSTRRALQEALLPWSRVEALWGLVRALQRSQENDANGAEPRGHYPRASGRTPAR